MLRSPLSRYVQVLGDDPPRQVPPKYWDFNQGVEDFNQGVEDLFGLLESRGLLEFS